MNLVAEGNPVVTLLALDLLRLRVTNDVTGDYIYLELPTSLLYMA